METVTITAAINEKKKVEFYQTMESLKILIKSYCNKIDAEIDQGNNLVIRITFNSKKEMEQNFSNAEFNILKGSVRSLCENVRININ